MDRRDPTHVLLQRPRVYPLVYLWRVPIEPTYPHVRGDRVGVCAVVHCGVFHEVDARSDVSLDFVQFGSHAADLDLPVRPAHQP